MGTSIMLVIALLLLTVGGALFLQATRQRRADRNDYVAAEHRWMPTELQTARLEASERDMGVSLDGHHVPVRPDQVYRTADGRLIPVDTKVRKATGVYPYDLIELSLQRLALAQSPRYLGNARVAEHGYIRIADKAGRRQPVYRRVDLMDERQLIALYYRHQGITDGSVTPTSQSNPRACEGCGYFGRCASAAR